MATYDVKLISKREIAEGSMEFTLEKPVGFEYRAGQFGDIVLPSPEGTPKQDHIHGFSFVSAPFEPHLRMATRMRNTPFKNAIRQIADGTQVGLIATFGDFTLQKNEKVPAVFVIGGIGITPVLSMIAQATHDKTQHQLILIYANRTPAQAAYLQELEQLAQVNENFKLVLVFTDQQGHVEANLLRREIRDLTGSRYYLAGPEGMVKAMRAQLVEIGADEDSIRTEEFEGY